MALTIEEQSAKEPGAEIDREYHLRISLLGEFSIRLEDQTVSLPTPSYQSLLAYLITHAGQSHFRQKLAFQFWPDSTESQARTNLRKALYTLRQTLPDAADFLVVNQQTVQWRPDAPCDVDAWQFETAVTQSKQADSTAEQQSYLEQAAGAYHGDFLPGHYDDWVLATREKIRHHYLAALEQLLLLHENQRRYPAAISLARRLLREDPLHEAAYRRLMRLQSLDGNVAGALRTYHDCSTRLQRDLGVDPSPATREAYERLLRMKAPPSPLAPARLSLVARKQAWQSLQSAWKKCSRGQAGVVLLSGEAGIGKTRLAEEMLEWAERQGLLALTAVCYPSEKQLAYAPVANWLRNKDVRSVFNRLGKRQLVECSRLLPELLEQQPDLPDPGPLTESWQRQHLFSSLTQPILQLRQPFLLFIDDLPYCDQDTLDWLLYLLHYDPAVRFLLVGAARSEEITPDHALIEWRRQLEKDGRLTSINLGRLDAQGTAQLAGNILKQPLDRGQAQRLYVETEGNPLFVVEMARAGIAPDLDSAQASALPPLVQSVIETRLARLSRPTFELAQLAATIGRSFTFTLLDRACVQDEDKIINGLDELWQHRIVREQGSEAYDFSHDKLRQVSYDSLSQARRRQLHKQVWGAMERLYIDNIDPVSGQIAAHCEASGQYREAITYYKRAATAAQAVYSNKDTLDYLQQAITLFPRTDVGLQQQIEIYEQQGDVLMKIGRYEEAEAALATAVFYANDAVSKARLVRKQGDLQISQQHLADADKFYNDALQILGPTPAAAANEDWWRCLLDTQICRGYVLYYNSQLREMASLIDKMQGHVASHSDPDQQRRFLKLQKMLLFQQKRFRLDSEDVALSRRILDLAVQYEDRYQVAENCFDLGFAYLFAGSFDEAVRELSVALCQAEDQGNIYLQEQCLAYLTVTHRFQDNVSQVQELLQRHHAVTVQSGNSVYYGVLKGNEAWLSSRLGNQRSAQIQGQKALSSWGTMPYPFKWIALWPLLAAAVTTEHLDDAVGYGTQLLHPTQQFLGEKLTAVLQQAIDAWEDNQPHDMRANLQQALQQAQKYHYL